MSTEPLIKERLMAFFGAMHTWETMAYQQSELDESLFDDDDWCNKQTDIRTQIYQAYFVQKHRDEQIIEFDGLSDVPYYDPNLEHITRLDIKPNEAHAFTNRTYVDEAYEREYRLVLVDNVWLIDDIKERYCDENTWNDVVIL